MRPGSRRRRQARERRRPVRVSGRGRACGARRHGTRVRRSGGHPDRRQHEEGPAVADDLGLRRKGAGVTMRAASAGGRIVEVRRDVDPHPVEPLLDVPEARRDGDPVVEPGAVPGRHLPRGCEDDQRVPVGEPGWRDLVGTRPAQAVRPVRERRGSGCRIGRSRPGRAGCPGMNASVDGWASSSRFRPATVSGWSGQPVARASAGGTTPPANVPRTSASSTRSRSARAFNRPTSYACAGAHPAPIGGRCQDPGTTPVPGRVRGGQAVGAAFGEGPGTSSGLRRFVIPYIAPAEQRPAGGEHERQARGRELLAPVEARERG